MIRLTVTSAFPLDDAQTEKLEKYFSKKYGGVRKTKYIVDDALIGGITVFDGEKIYDGSVAGRLSRLVETLKGDKK
jgi:F-type H+-transporting ATPase subunit delta